MSLITTSDALAAFCARLSAEPFITVDTEFMRERTYYPQLCLVQVAGKNEAHCIDPLAEGIDMAPLFALLENPAVLKVFHACRQDLEMFYHLTGRVPAPVFDSQVAAMVCGFGESVGYETLVNKMLGKGVDKSARFTDWSRRPLTDRQVEYALCDVTYLYEIYEKLVGDKKCAARLDWTREEMERLVETSLYDNPPMEAWNRLRLRSRSPKYLNMLRAIAAWREIAAQSEDVPRGRILRDDILVELAQQNPACADELLQQRGLASLGRKRAAQLFEAMQEAAKTPKEEWPKLEDRPIIPEGTEDMMDLLRVLLKTRCTAENIAPKLIATRDDLETFTLTGDAPFCHGWRNEVFGQYAKRLISGTLALAFDCNQKLIRYCEV